VANISKDVETRFSDIFSWCVLLFSYCFWVNGHLNCANVYIFTSDFEEVLVLQFGGWAGG